MLKAILIASRFVILVFSGRKQFALENAALRQQLVILKRNVRRPRLHDRDRLFWIVLRTIWKDWKSVLVIVRPEGVISWQRSRFSVIGSIRRECLNHVIVINDNHLRRLLKEYFRYYHESRTHLSLDKDSPHSRAVQSNKSEHIIQISQVGGLHHRYERRAA